MFKLFNKKYLSVLLTVLSWSTVSSSLEAQNCCYPLIEEDYCCQETNSNKFYIGAFGGMNYSNATKMRQTGTVFFLEAAGGPLAVDARGHSRKNSTGFGGVQVGYAWNQSPFGLGGSNWSISTAAEIEASFYSHTKKGSLINPTLRLPEHDFRDSLPMDVGVYLVNGVFSLNSDCLKGFSPYVGAGVGVANLYVRRANSEQVSPIEPDVNHFNSKRSDSSWAFAAQAKAGLGYNLFEGVRLFGEYRFLFIDTSNFNFGSTMYPDHATTTTWNVEVKNMWYNAFAFGIQFAI